jgi:hypothetical protein
VTRYRVVYASGKARIIWSSPASVATVAFLFGDVLAIEEAQ